MSDPATEFVAATVKPGRALAKMGLKLPVPRLRGDPRLWRYLPLGVVAQTLIDNGLLDRKSVFPTVDVMRGPGYWVFGWRHHPHAARAALYEWLRGEWSRYGYILAESRNWMGWEIRQQASPGEWSECAKALVRVRDAVARCAGIADWPPRQETFSPQYPATIYPEVADYVHALDQSIDRIQDTLRRIVLDRIVRGDCTEAERIEAIGLLQRDYDRDRWPTAIADLNAVCGPPEPVPLRPAPATG